MPESREIKNVIPQNQTESQVRIVDLGREKDEPIPREIKTWLEKVEESSSQPVNDLNGQPLLTPSAPQNPKITLPATRTAFAAGFKKGFSDAGHWFSVLLFRLIKIKKGNVVFKADDT